jgi:hypothetical protein
LNGGVPVTVTGVTASNTTATVVLTLSPATPIGTGKTVTVSYAAPTVDATVQAGAIQDTAGNDAISFTTTLLFLFKLVNICIRM